MRNRNSSDRRCSYIVVLDQATGHSDDLRDLASYLSTLDVADCDVVVLDSSPRAQFDLNARVLRWVGRHLPVRPELRTVHGEVDLIRASVASALCEKVIVAGPEVRYTREAVERLCAMLEVHEVVEPQGYLDPLPWWGNLEAGRMLVHRGIEPQPDHGATFGYRRTALRGLRGVAGALAFDDPVRRLAASGAEVFAAADVFVRREPGTFREWLRERPRLAGQEFALPARSAFFFSLVPLLLALMLLGGAKMMGAYACAVAIGSVGLAVRGRIGASSFFPMHSCLFAPLWVLERSVSVYWALFLRLRGADLAPAGVVVPDRARGEQVAAGE